MRHFWCSCCARYNAREDACQLPATACPWEKWADDVAVDGSLKDAGGGIGLGNPAAIRTASGRWTPAWVKWQTSDRVKGFSSFNFEQLHDGFKFETAVLKELERSGFGQAPRPFSDCALDTDRRNVWRIWYAMSRAPGRDWERARADIAAAPHRPLFALCEALVALHRRGFGHYDLKPGNIFWDDATGRLTLIDFGSAKGSDRWRVTADCHRSPFDNVNVGTMPWVSPEGRQKRLVALTPEADDFVYGLLFARAVLGLDATDDVKTAFPKGLPAPETVDRLRRAVRRMDRGSAALADLVADRLLAEKPAARRGGLELVLRELSRLGWDRSAAPRRKVRPSDPARAPGPRPSGGRSAHPLAVAAVLAAAVLGGWWLLSGSGDSGTGGGGGGGGGQKRPRNPPAYTTTPPPVTNVEPVVDPVGIEEDPASEGDDDEFSLSEKLESTPSEPPPSDSWKMWNGEWNRLKPSQAGVYSTRREQCLKYLEKGWNDFPEHRDDIGDIQKSNPDLWPRIEIDAPADAFEMKFAPDQDAKNPLIQKRDWVRQNEYVSLKPDGTNDARTVSMTVWKNGEDEPCGVATNFTLQRFKDSFFGDVRSRIPELTWTIVVEGVEGVTPDVRWRSEDEQTWQRVDDPIKPVKLPVEPHTKKYYVSVNANGYESSTESFQTGHRNQPGTTTVRLKKLASPEPPPDPNAGRRPFHLLPGKKINPDDYLFSWIVDVQRMNRGEYTWDDIPGAKGFRPVPEPVRTSKTSPALDDPSSYVDIDFSELFTKASTDTGLSLDVKPGAGGSWELTVPPSAVPNVGDAVSASVVYAVTPAELVSRWKKTDDKKEVLREMTAVLQAKPAWTNRRELTAYWDREIRLHPQLTISGTDGRSYALFCGTDERYSYDGQARADPPFGGFQQWTVRPKDDNADGGAPERTKPVSWNAGDVAWNLGWNAKPVQAVWYVPAELQNKWVVDNDDKPTYVGTTVALRPVGSKTLTWMLSDRRRTFKLIGKADGTVSVEELQTQPWIKLSNPNDFPVYVKLPDSTETVPANGTVTVDSDGIKSGSSLTVSAPGKVSSAVTVPSLIEKENPDPTTADVPMLQDAKPLVTSTYPRTEMSELADDYRDWLEGGARGQREKARALWTSGRVPDAYGTRVQDALKYIQEHNVPDGTWPFTPAAFKTVKDSTSRIQALLKLYGCSPPP